MEALFMYLEDTSEHDMFDVKPVSTTAPLVMEFGRCSFSDRLMILKKPSCNQVASPFFC